MRYIFLLLLVFGFFPVSAQTGNYFLTHYSPGDNQGNFMCFDMAQDQYGFFYYATRKGILKFDGKNWELLPGTGAVYSLTYYEGTTPTMYWAGDAGYGKIDRVNNSSQQSLTLLSKAEVTDVFESLNVENTQYFLTSQQLIKDDSVFAQATQSTGSFTGMIELFNNVYVITEKSGLQQVTNQATLQLPSFTLPQQGEVLFASKFDQEYLVGITSNKVFRLSASLKLTELKLEDQQYADASVIIGGTWINKDLFALGTLRGGLIFIQTATGKTQEIINYNTGLPDNEIFVLVSGKNQSIWAAHEYGFTRVASQLPLRSFSHYTGLTGNLLCAKTFGEQVYVGTSSGLFYLEKQELYEEIIYYVNEKVSDNKKTKAAQPEETEQKSESQKRGFRWFKKKNKTKETEGTTTANKNPATPTYRKVKKTERVLRSSNFVYRKIEGIDSKVTQLLQFNDKILAAGLSGLFEIKENKAWPIEQEPIRYVYTSSNLNSIIASTYSDEVKTYQKQDEKWISQTPLPNLTDQINTIADGKENELWLLGQYKAYQLNVTNQTIESLNTVEIQNPKSDENVGVYLNGQFLIANTSGFFVFDKTKKVFTSVDTLTSPEQYMVSGNSLLFYDSHAWRQVGETPIRSTYFINLLSNLRYMSIDEDQKAMWLISGNTLFRFLNEDFNSNEMATPLVLKSVKHGERIIDLNAATIEENKSISFDFTQADYLAADAMEYRYKLDGLDDAWSSWSRENGQIDFPYLPAGNYTLHVQSQNVFGVQNETQPITFVVLPPYWQRTWFYALEFIVFAALVLLSYRLSERYLIISRVLSLLTIIMLIQFIQTVVSEVFETRASPVMDFFIQVLVALVILPAEGYLQKRMIKSSSAEAKAKLTAFIKRKTKTTPNEEP